MCLKVLQLRLLCNNLESKCILQLQESYFLNETEVLCIVARWLHIMQLMIHGVCIGKKVINMQSYNTCIC